MTSNELYLFLYNWVNQVLNIDGGMSVPIIRAFQNAPEPSEEDPYVVIDSAPNRTKIGMEYMENETDGSGNITYTDDMQFVIEIWEVNGRGDLLDMLVKSINKRSIREIWDDELLSYISESDIRNMPRTQENNWKNEAMIELTLRIGEGTIEEIGYIEDVEYTGTIPAQGRSGDHVITNT